MRIVLLALALFAVGCGGAVNLGDDGGLDAGKVDGQIPIDGSLGCSSSTCPGCCNAKGSCVLGSMGVACGRKGDACTDCSVQGKICVESAGDAGGGVCASADAIECSSKNCAGCCEGNTCRDGTALTKCGIGGVACGACPLGQACTNGACVPSPGSCGPNSCAGCCIGTTCMWGVESTACGKDGAKCSNCSCEAAAPLYGGVCATSKGCGEGPCPNGCCDLYYQCRPGNDNLECGTGGTKCTICANNGTCAGNGCTKGKCDQTTCPNGCCDAFGVCQMQHDLEHCGSGGRVCVSCPTGFACLSHTCTPAPPCNSTTCPNGCCDIGGNCTTGSTNNSCGSGGVACAICNGSDQCLNKICQ